MQHARGFTLIETIVVIAVTAIASLMIFAGINTLYEDHRISLEQASAIQSARRAIEDIAETLRRTTQASDGSYPIAVMDPYAITFYADEEGDGLVERVRYTLSGEELVRGITEPTGTPLSYDPVANEVVATTTTDVRNIPLATPLFRYYDSAGAEVTNMGNVDEVRFVEVEVIININPATLPTDFTLYSSAALRNLKDNL